MLLVETGYLEEYQDTENGVILFVRLVNLRMLDFLRASIVCRRFRWVDNTEDVLLKTKCAALSLENGFDL
jgi:hypothetical protein